MSSDGGPRRCSMTGDEPVRLRSVDVKIAQGADDIDGLVVREEDEHVGFVRRTAGQTRSGKRRREGTGEREMLQGNSQSTTGISRTLLR